MLPHSRFSRSLATAAIAAAVTVASLGVSGAANASAGGRVTTVERGNVGDVQAPSRSWAKGYVGTAPNITPESVIGTDGRTEVADTTVYPARAIGLIELGLQGSVYTCTGWLIDKNSILTAGHCSFEPDGVSGTVIEYAIFAPGQNGAEQPYGSCDVYEVMAPLAWRRDGSAKNDWSVMQLGTNDAGTITTCDVGTTVGYLGYAYKAGADALTGSRARVQGYPGDKGLGDTQWTMRGKIKKSTKQMLYHNIDTAGGQSGSPIFDPAGLLCGGTPCGLGVHAYGVGLAGAGATYNAGPRITKGRFATISAYAAENG